MRGNFLTFNLSIKIVIVHALLAVLMPNIFSRISLVQAIQNLTNLGPL